MSERYLVTGVQLGMLKALTDESDIHHLIDNIIDNQFVGNSYKNIQDDVKIVSKVIEENPNAI